MLNKKLSKFLVLGLSVTLLAGCTDIIAKPNGYEEDKILEIEGLKDTGSEMNNMLKTIYDAMHDSSTLSTTTINMINEKLFRLYYGEYETIDAVVNNYKNNTSNTDEIKAFINEHKAYQELDDEGNRITTEEAVNLEIKRVIRSYNRIQNLISEKVVNALSVSDFKNLDGLFSEKLFALNVYKKLHKLSPEGSNIVKWNDFVANFDFYEPVELLPKLELFDDDTNTWTETQDGINKIIHITSVTEKGTNRNSTFGYYKEYIYNDILPDIYSHMLSEYYLYTNEYSTLGSKYARKATYISLTPNTKDIYNTKHVDLINYFAKENIKNATTANASDLHLLERAWIGYDVNDTEVVQLLNAAGFTYKTVKVDTTGLPGLTDAETVARFAEKYADILTSTGELQYFEGTLFGNVIEDFKEINPFDVANSSKSKENKFSGNNSYSYYDGLVKEIQTLRQKTYVTEGWGLKSDGFSGLDSSVKDRLMTINVATDLKENNADSHVSNYLSYIEGTGNYYLLPEKRLPGDETPFIFSSGTTKTIVQVEEAASVAKLSKKSSSENKYSSEKAEDVAFEICNLLADNSSVKSNAMEFFLEESEILYHDDKILEYFKDNYPNLFED